MGKNTELLAGQQFQDHSRDRLRAGRKRINGTATGSLSEIVANSTYGLTVMMNGNSNIVLELDYTQEIFDLSEEEKVLIEADIKAGKQFGKPPESFGITIIDDGIPFSEKEPQGAEDPKNPGSYVYNYDGALRILEVLAKIFPESNIYIRSREDQVQHMKNNPNKYTNIRFREVNGKFTNDDTTSRVWTADSRNVDEAYLAFLYLKTNETGWYVDNRRLGFPIYPAHG
ncbi:hypothetical protein KBD33_03110 [Candidatus Gracilibacteria bacterium]|nr:hypothetical protein [Candidatus Gracilibacteria bacterium]